MDWWVTYNTWEKWLVLIFKGPYADHILIPPGSTGSSAFFGFKWKPIFFLISNLKFRLQTPCSFGDMAENVKLIGIPINNFLCIYIIASSPGLHTLFCLWTVNKKLPRGETSQNTFQRSRSISWKCKINMVKWAHPPLTLKYSENFHIIVRFGYLRFKLLVFDEHQQHCDWVKW